jgi:hypothetical protein
LENDVKINRKINNILLKNYEYCNTTKYFAAGVDPNFASDESKKRPVLLAAEKGHWRVLETFKRYNYLQGSVTNTNRNMMVNFAVWTKNSDETVLHLALKRTNYKLHQVIK